jgi:hypothetical protein
LIANGHSKPEQADSYGYTALIWACKNNLVDVAISLVSTGKSNHEQVDRNKKNALYYAKKYDMLKNMPENVVIELDPKMKQYFYNQALAQAINRQSLKKYERVKIITPKTSIGDDLLRMPEFKSYFAGMKESSKTKKGGKKIRKTRRKITK